MPTTLDRTNITHTPQVRHLLDVAGTRWPGASPRALMINLMEVGADTVAGSHPDTRGRARASALERLAAEIDADYGHWYEDTYLEEVRAGWE